MALAGSSAHRRRGPHRPFQRLCGRSALAGADPPVVCRAHLVVRAGGVQKGVERTLRWMMPALFIMILMLVAFGLTLPNAMAGCATS